MIRVSFTALLVLTLGACGGNSNNGYTMGGPTSSTPPAASTPHDFNSYDAQLSIAANPPA